MSITKWNKLKLTLTSLLGASTIAGGALAKPLPVVEHLNLDGTYTLEVEADNVTALTGLTELTTEEYNRIDGLPAWRPITPAGDARLYAPGLPSSVDNSTNMYFRPIFNQSGGSCGQASGIGYNFTYEMNYMRGTSAAYTQNQYPTHYTWNFINGGVGNGSWYFDGWDIIRQNGCPNLPTWGGLAVSSTMWMDGYDNYLAGMDNRVVSYQKIENVNTPPGLEALKTWLYDRGTGAAAGGLANFAVYISGSDYVTLGNDSADAGKSMLVKWGNDGYHAMTIVGYNDDVKYDFNGDGLYTNDIDITNDGVVDMSDWEIGALKFANSWGTSYEDNGFAYMAYKSIADEDKRGVNPFTWNAVHIVTTEAYHPVDGALKVEMIHPDRNDLVITTSVEQNGTTYTKDYAMAFNSAGGDLPLEGSGYSDTLEFGLDISELLGQIDLTLCAHINLVIKESDSDDAYNGTAVQVHLMDYTSGTLVATRSDDTFVTITQDDTTTVSIDRNCDIVPPTEDLRIEYMTNSTAAQTSTPSVNIRIHNDGDTAINLADIEAEYHYTTEANGQYEEAQVYYAANISNWTSIFADTSVFIESVGSERILVFSFDSGAPALGPGEVVEIQAGFHKSDWSPYNQLNDYSFGAVTSYQDWTAIGGFVNGTLVWGTTPF